MNIRHCGLLSAFACMLGACASTAPAVPPAGKHEAIYSQQETRALTLCSAMAGTAASVAERKLDNVPIEEVKKTYQSVADASLKEFQLATVDKVYSENVTSWWDYAVSFFDECAMNLGEVPAPRAQAANHCMQDGLVADLAYGFKTLGTAKQEAVAKLARAGAAGPRAAAIVDHVYSANEERPALLLKMWNTCIANYSANP